MTSPLGSRKANANGAAAAAVDATALNKRVMAVAQEQRGRRRVPGIMGGLLTCAKRSAAIRRLG